MDVARVLSESFHMLRRRPMLFVPRIITTILYSAMSLMSLWIMMSSIDLYSGAGGGLLGRPDPKQAIGLLSKAAILLVLTPLLYFIDMLSYAMYPRLVSDYNEGREIDLSRALVDALGAWRVVVVLVALLLSVAVGASIAVGISAAIYMAFDIPAALGIGVIVVVAVLLFFLMTMFFVIPAAVLERKGIMGSFEESFRLGMRYRGPLLKMNAVFLAMVVATFAIVYYARADTLASAASILLFIGVRFIEAVVYTYLSVSNPLAYIHAKVADAKAP